MIPRTPEEIARELQTVKMGQALVRQIKAIDGIIGGARTSNVYADSQFLASLSNVRKNLVDIVGDL